MRDEYATGAFPAPRQRAFFALLANCKSGFGAPLDADWDPSEGCCCGVPGEPLYCGVPPPPGEADAGEALLALDAEPLAVDADGEEALAGDALIGDALLALDADDALGDALAPFFDFLAKRERSNAI